MATHRPLVIIAGQDQQIPVGDTLDPATLLTGIADDTVFVLRSGVFAATELTIAAAGTASLDGDLDITGDFGCDTITSTGLATLGGSLIVVGESTLGDDTTVDGSLTVKSGSASPTTVFEAQDSSDNSAFRVIVSPIADDNLFLGDMSPPTTITSGTRNLYLVTGGSTIADGLTSGFGLVCIGHEAGRDITSGFSNVCIGLLAGRLMTTGDSNTFIGESSGGEGVVTGQFNAGVGRRALRALTSGIRNMAMGPFALDDITTQSRNLAIGVSAGDGNTSGNSNTYIGASAGGNLGASLGDDNIFIGDSAGLSTTGQLTTASNSIAIGADAFASASHQIVLGNANHTQTVLRGTAAGGGVRIVQGTTAEAFHVYNTFTSDTNMERVSLTWNSNVAELRMEKGTGGGTARDLALIVDGTELIRLTTGGNVLMSNLPTSDPAVAGALWSDSGVLTVSSG